MWTPTRASFWPAPQRRRLTGARYAALGVIGEDEWLGRFVHVGLDDETVRRIGHLPGVGASWVC